MINEGRIQQIDGNRAVRARALEGILLSIDDIVENFRSRQPEYERILDYIDRLMKEYKKGPGKIVVSSFSSRIKPEDSFIKKVNKIGISSDDIWKEVNDIVGTRIICVFHEDKKTIEEEFIEPNFHICEIIKYEYPDFDDTERTYEEKLKVVKEGYQSWHYTAKLKQEHITKGKLIHIFIEIQLRTNLENALAEFTHDMYKSMIELPDDLRRTVTSLSRYVYAIDKHLISAKEQYEAILPSLPGEPSTEFPRGDFSGINLSHYDFSGYNLKEANFEDAQLLWCNFNEADLSGVIFRNAKVLWPKMRGTTLTHSDLTNADISYADLTKANLNFSKMERCRLSYAELGDAKLNEIEARYADFSFASLKGASFRNADLREAQFVFNYYYEEADFTDANMEGTIIHLRRARTN